jgi:hypothetical protein
VLRHEFLLRVVPGEVWAMTKLVTKSQFTDPDAAYAALMQARRGLSETAAADLDVRLVLILANHIGDLDVLNEAIALARDAGAPR